MSGEIRIMGKEMNDKTRVDLKADGLIEGPSYYSHLTGMENMRIVQNLINIPNKNIEKAIQIKVIGKSDEEKEKLLPWNETETWGCYGYRQLS